MKDKILYLTSPLELRQEPNSPSLAASFSGKAYTGAIISEWGYRFVVDLSSTTVPQRQPLLNEHNRSDPIGLITEAVNDGREIRVAGDLHSDLGGSAEMIARRAEKGFPYQMSIGLYDIKEEARLKEGEQETINGQVVSGPVLILRGGTIRETSVVVLGADSSTNTAFFSAQSSQEPLSATSNSGGCDPMATDDRAAEIANLNQQLSDMSARLEEYVATLNTRDQELASAREALQEHDRQAKLAAVREMFAKAGKEFSEEAAGPFLELSTPALEAMASLIQTPKLPKDLTRDLAAGDPEADTSKLTNIPSPNEIYAARRA